jgi:hypothetical protein
MTTQQFEWQDYAEWAAKIAMSALVLYAGFALVDRYNLGSIAQAIFWPTYPVLMYWLVIREIHFPRPAKPFKPTGSLQIVFSLQVVFSQQERGFGTHEEREAIHRLTDKLDRLLATSSGGQFDGDEFGDGECTLFMYGDNPNVMYEAISSTLIESSIVSGGRVEFRSPSSSTPYRTIQL